MLKVKNLRKEYPSFTLDDVSFKLEKGYIMGFIGANGAGKSTTMKSMLNLIPKTAGEVNVFGKNIRDFEQDIKQDVGLMIESFSYYPNKKLKAIIDVYRPFYRNWSDEKCREYMAKFELDEEKRIKELSAGMLAKFSIMLALSHDAKLIVMDEPTSGLDPMIRDELLDVFRDIIEDGERSILFSTHITSDLDKCADYILFICDGKIILNSTKEDIINSHKLIKGTKSALSSELEEKIIGIKKTSVNFSGLVLKTDEKKTEGIIFEEPNLEDIMLYYNRREKK